MRVILTILSLLTISFTALAQEANPYPTARPRVTEGVYNIEGKMLFIKGPAALAIWNQMVVFKGTQLTEENGRTRNIRESNGTFCEQVLEQTKTMATPALNTVCGIAQGKVGT